MEQPGRPLTPAEKDAWLYARTGKTEKLAALLEDAAASLPPAIAAISRQPAINHSGRSGF